MNIRGFEFTINNKSSSWVWGTLESWDPETFNWIEKNKGGEIFWDVGAWIGPFSLFGSKLFDNVISFEPDWVAAKVLEDHINDNQLKNVTLVREGLYSDDTHVDFSFIGGKFGDSLSSICHKNSNSVKIKTLSITKAMELYGDPDFLKIDIEGGEEFLIDDLVKYKFKRFCMSNRYNRKDEKIDYIPDDGDFYYELKK